MQELKQLNVLFVEDDELVRDAFTLLVENLFKNFYTAKDSYEALEIYKKHNIDLVITDIKMPKLSGLDLASIIKKENKEQIILVITAFSDMDYMKKAIDIGIDGYLTKPVFKESLFKTLKKFANIIIERKKSQEYLIILKNLIEEKNYPVCISKNNQIIISNQIFKNIFSEIDNLEEFEEKYNIEFDFSKEKTETISNKKFLIKAAPFSDSYYKIEFKEADVL
ncbi:two-component system, response regulator YesN [Lebetimonas natsushimae]|uniref:Two-component system, response regulator YesN n=1 Tax=Lebetimonas natsushimae TaxID=1936991 RepID=A0A292YGZ1_9BACT|nr:response regulator [Lebetimonas natsushimae]GAX88229.1 two-component system, response regulator YesN [Lebetimonas natsushimae]